ncbi:unnamed protein product [Urochloa humidicola]
MLQLVHRLAHHGLCRTLVNTRRHDHSTAATPQLSPFRAAAISGGFNDDGRRHARQLVPPSGGDIEPKRRTQERKKKLAPALFCNGPHSSQGCWHAFLGNS